MSLNHDSLNGIQMPAMRWVINQNIGLRQGVPDFQ
jgi:hypothetical protein